MAIIMIIMAMMVMMAKIMLMLTLAALHLEWQRQLPDPSIFCLSVFLFVFDLYFVFLFSYFVNKGGAALHCSESDSCQIPVNSMKASAGDHCESSPLSSCSLISIIIRHSVRMSLEFCPAEPRNWKRPNGVGNSDMSIIWCNLSKYVWHMGGGGRDDLHHSF